VDQRLFGKNARERFEMKANMGCQEAGWLHKLLWRLQNPNNHNHQCLWFVPTCSCTWKPGT